VDVNRAADRRFVKQHEQLQRKYYSQPASEMTEKAKRALPGLVWGSLHRSVRAELVSGFNLTIVSAPQLTTVDAVATTEHTFVVVFCLLLILAASIFLTTNLIGSCRAGKSFTVCVRRWHVNYRKTAFSRLPWTLVHSAIAAAVPLPMAVIARAATLTNYGIEDWVGAIQFGLCLMWLGPSWAKPAFICKQSDPLGAVGSDKEARNMCLVHSLNALGVPIKCDKDGPFRALADGNPMLTSFGLKLVPAKREAVSKGKYVMWCGGHFSAVFVDEKVHIIEKHRSLSLNSIAVLDRSTRRLWFRLVPLHEAVAPTMGLADDAVRRIDQNWSSAKRRKALPHSSGSAAANGSLTPEQLERIRNNRETAIRIRLSRLVIPRPPSSWNTPRVPSTPTDWLSFDVTLPSYTFLEHLHTHPRDRHIVFFAETHTYLIRGSKSLGSVTGVVHAFAQEFHAQAVIQQMMAGSRWPRPGYLQETYPDGFLDMLACSPSTAGLAEMLRSQDRDELAICAEVRRLVGRESRLQFMVPVIAMTEPQIMQKWDENRVMAANMGTWMHFTFEAFLNSCPVESDSVEFRLFLRFVSSLAGLSAYRTEWTIYGDEERLAGSIDFCAIDAAGELALFDWKRSKDCVVAWFLRPGSGIPEAHKAE